MTTEHSPLWRRLAQAFAGTQAVSQGKATVHAAAARPALASSMRPLALEQRFMFDGAGASDAAHAVAEAAHPVARIAAMVATSMNEAPTLTVNLKVPQILEDATNINGVSIVSLVDSASPDPDASASLAGLVVVGNSANSATEGTWQYSSNGTDWYSIGTVSNNAGLVLSSATLLRFEPVADYNGAISALTVRALGNTYSGPFSVGEAAQTRVTLNADTNGGSTAISAETRTISGSIIAVNDAPSFTLGSNVTVLEDAGAQTLVGWASGISAGPANESGQTLTWVVSNSNNALFSVQPSIDSSGTLSFKPSANAYGVATVSVTLKDNGGTANGGVDTSTTQTFTITVTPVNDAPTGEVTLGGSSTEGQTLTADLSKLADVDGIVGGTFSFQWQQLDGGIWMDIAGANAATMSLGSDQVGKQVRAKVSYVDNGGTLETVFSTPSGTVAGVIPMATAIERASDQIVASTTTSIVYTVTFNVAVTGVDISDFMLNPTGTASGSIASVSGSGKSWQVTVNNLMGDGTLRLDLKSSGTGIQGAGGNTSIAGGYTNGQTFTLDHTAPAAPSAPTLTAASDTGSSASDGITNVTTPTLTGTAEAGSTVTLYDTDGVTVLGTSTADGSGNWSITSSTLAQGLHSLSVSAIDTAGNQSTASNKLNVTIDTTPPTATVVVTNSNLGIGDASLVTITFSEAVTGFDNSDLSVANGTLSTVSSSDGGITWTAVLTPTAGITQSYNHIILNNAGVTDLAGNSGVGTTSSNAYAVDSARPTATIVIANPILTAGQTSLVTITFSEAVTGFDNSDLSVANGTLSVVSSSDGGITWTGTFTPNDNFRDTTNVIALNNAGYTDLAGNAGIGVTSSGNYSIDTVRPTATIVVANSALNVGATSLVTITFSEAVTGFTNADLTVENGTLSAVSSSDGGVTWTAIFTPTKNVSNGRNLITLDNSGVQNASGNAGSSITSSNSYSVDTQSPTATIVVVNSNLGIGGTSLVTITFSEAVTGFSNADLTTDNGTLSAVSSSDGGITWTAILTPTAGITQNNNHIILNNADVADLAGNLGSGTTSSNAYTVDSDRPTATIVMSNGQLGIGGSALVTITFSEKVTGFDLSDLMAANGTLSNLTSSDGGKTWTCIFIPDSGTHADANVITLDNSSVTDLAGNHGVGFSSSAPYSVNTVLPEPVPPMVAWPSVTITERDAAAGAGMLPPPLVVPGMPGVLDSLVRGLDAFGPMVAGGGLTPAPFIEGNDRDSKISALASILGGGFPAAPLGVLPYEDVGIGAFGFSARDAWAPMPAESGLVQLTPAPVLEVDAGRQLDWQVPATLFGHSDPLAQVQLSLTLADGRPLPTWLQFDARTGQMKGTVPAGLQGDLALRLTARDGQGREVNTTIQLKLGASGPAARAGMAEQLQRAAQQRAGQLAAQRL